MNAKSLKSFQHLFDQSTMQILYNRYKSYILPVVIMVCSLVLFITFIIPQVQHFLSLGNEENTAREKITLLESNIDFLSSLDEKNLDAQLQTVVSALPAEKDFVGVMSAISQASAIAGVAVGDFSFQLGDLSLVPSDSSPTVNETVVATRPAIEIVLNINGGIDAGKRFIKELSNRLPLSEIRQVEISEKSSNIIVEFYYKPFPKIRFEEASKLSPLSQTDLSLIEKLSSMESFSDSSLVPQSFNL